MLNRYIFAIAAAFIVSVMLCVSSTTASYAACTPYSYSFTNGTLSDATQLNSNFTTIMSCANGLVNATPPTVQVFTFGSGTYTKPTSVTWVEVRMIGGGGGGGGAGSLNQGTSGGTTTFGSSFLTANGGVGGYGGNQGAQTQTGATATGGDTNIAGGVGGGGMSNLSSNFGPGGMGASTPFGAGGAPTIGNTVAVAANTGAGGGGGSADSSCISPSAYGGGAGAYLEKIISSPAATYTYAVGAGGSGGAHSCSDYDGGAGGSGLIIVTEHYNY